MIIPINGVFCAGLWTSPDLEFMRVRTAGHSKAKTARRLHRVFTRQAVPGHVCDLLTDKRVQTQDVRLTERLNAPVFISSCRWCESENNYNEKIQHLGKFIWWYDDYMMTFHWKSEKIQSIEMRRDFQQPWKMFKWDVTRQTNQFGSIIIWFCKWSQRDTYVCLYLR